MQWVILSLLLINIGLCYCVYGALRDVSLRLEKTEYALQVIVHSMTTRQSAIAHRVGYTATPTVDARGRTTRRDSDDLPPTGRMSRVATHRSYEESTEV